MMNETNTLLSKGAVYVCVPVHVCVWMTLSLEFVT